MNGCAWCLPFRGDHASSGADAETDRFELRGWELGGEAGEAGLEERALAEGVLDVRVARVGGAPGFHRGDDARAVVGARVGFGDAEEGGDGGEEDRGGGAAGGLV